MTSCRCAFVFVPLGCAIPRGNNRCSFASFHCLDSAWGLVPRRGFMERRCAVGLAAGWGQGGRCNSLPLRWVPGERPHCSCPYEGGLGSCQPDCCQPTQDRGRHRGRRFVSPDGILPIGEAISRAARWSLDLEVEAILFRADFSAPVVVALAEIGPDGLATGAELFVSHTGQAAVVRCKRARKGLPALGERLDATTALRVASRMAAFSNESDWEDRAIMRRRQLRALAALYAESDWEDD